MIPDPAERYEFLGFTVSAHDAEAFADRLVLRDQRDGRLVKRMRTHEYVGIPRRRKASA